MNTNYDLLMEEEIKKVKPGSKLLLHACCAPCSSAVIERLGEIFEITIYFYNPNIDTLEEYNKRLKELEKFTSMFHVKYPISILSDGHNKEDFQEIAKGLEQEKERGKRCYKCYNLRLERTAKVALENNFDYFATTLTLSPYKNSNWLNEIGDSLAKKYSVNYLYSDFKKKNGYKRSIELSKEYNLYRQDYCGCIYSYKERQENCKVVKQFVN